MRGSLHDTRLREFTIDGAGMHIGEPFRRVSGILSGVHTFSDGDAEGDADGADDDGDNGNHGRRGHESASSHSGEAQGGV
jgi:hypothetical protein